MSEWSFVILFVKIIFFALIILMCCSRRRKNRQPQMLVVTQQQQTTESGTTPFTLSQHSGVGRSSVGRWTVVHTRNEPQLQGGANLSESCIPPGAEAGFLSPSGHQLINPSSLPMPPPPPYEEDPPAYDTLNLAAEEPSKPAAPATSVASE